MNLFSSIDIVQLTDTHLFATPEGTMKGCPTVPSFERVIKAVETLPKKPDILLLTGDLTQDETPESYQFLCDQLVSLSLPVYWLAGNHDIPALMTNIFAKNGFLPDKSFKRENWRFILLHSVISGHTEGELSSESLDFLEQELLKDSLAPTLIAVHHHPFPINCPFMDNLGIQNGDDLVKIIEQHSQVKLVIFGHIHQSFETRKGNITYLGCPSTGVQFSVSDEGIILPSINPSFRWLTLFPDGRFTTKVIQLN